MRRTARAAIDRARAARANAANGNPKPSANGLTGPSADSGATNRDALAANEPQRKPEIVEPIAPPQDTLFGIDTADPILSRIDTGDSPGKRPPGRPRKDGTETARQSGLEVLKLSDIFFSLHQMAAAILHVPDLELDKEEARRLAEAAAAVGEHYRIGLDPRKAAWVNLAAVAGSIYGPRIMAAAIRRKKALEELKRATAPQPGRPPERPVPVPPVTMPVSGRPNGGTGPYANVSAQDLWAQPAADFPGMG